jgi:hypothetical protein
VTWCLRHYLLPSGFGSLIHADRRFLNRCGHFIKSLQALFTNCVSKRLYRYRVLCSQYNSSILNSATEENFPFFTIFPATHSANSRFPKKSKLKMFSAMFTANKLTVCHALCKPGWLTQTISVKNLLTVEMSPGNCVQ